MYHPEHEVNQATISVTPTGVETDKAVLVKVGAEEEQWIPKSIMIEEELDQMMSMEEVFLTLPQWFVEQNNL